MWGVAETRLVADADTGSRAEADATRKIDDIRELVEKTIWMVRNVASPLRPAALFSVSRFGA
ncbi:hypothetical protein [Caballeronia mineralivorans]|jgi:hypothetical protein|uniref:hypothetical protein n=1 Tax=Caballeronia mineralivorans TaxID=2010198 RepID=UPI002AFE1594|nr:hypothetical protein [Caballeronia mineralivorans]MEA3103880.1 hypothetical protein [Caballeronia mineralivorans]